MVERPDEAPADASRTEGARAAGTSPASPRSDRILLTVLVVGLLLAGGGTWAYLDSQKEVVPAPDFTLTSTGYENGTLGEPVTFSLSDYEGQVVLLDMMAVTCASCRVLTSEVLVPLHETYDDLVILSIDVWAAPESGKNLGGETRENLIELQEEEDVPWRHALDTDQVWAKYRTSSLPMIVLVDADGDIVYQATGVPPKQRVADAVESALAGEADAIPVLQLGIVGLAFVAGVASFFAPCSVALIPAYMGFLLQSGQKHAQEHRLRRTLFGGLATAAGIVAVYALLAVLLWWQGAAIVAALPWLAPAMAVLLIAFGLLLFFNISWDAIALRLGMGRIDGRRGFFAFGLGYGLAAFGCTGPLFLPILVGAFVESTAVGFAALAAYTLAVSAFVFAAAVLVATGQQGRLGAMLSRTALITRISAIVMIAAGAYLLWFDVRAGVL